MSIKDLLHEEIENRLSDLGRMDPKSDEYKAATDGVTKLMDRAIEMDKFDSECEKEARNREFDEEFRITQAKEERKDRIVKNIIAGAGVLLPIGLTIWGTKTSLKFEETGTVTTAVGRGFINRLFPRK